MLSSCLYEGFRCSTVQYSIVQYSTVQYSTVQYSTAQYSTVQYSTVQYSTARSNAPYTNVTCEEKNTKQKAASKYLKSFEPHTTTICDEYDTRQFLLPSVVELNLICSSLLDISTNFVAVEIDNGFLQSLFGGL